MALRSSDREASLSRPRIDPGPAGEHTDASAIDGKPASARRGRVVYLGPPEPTPIPARSRSKPVPTPASRLTAPTPWIVARPVPPSTPRPKSGNRVHPTRDAPRPFAFAPFAARVREVDSRRLELQRTLDENERRIADIDREIERADRPLVGWFSRRAAEHNEARLNALVEDREALETALAALTIDANFASDGIARPLFTRLASRFDAMAVVPAAAPAAGTISTLSIIASPVPGLHLHHAQRRDLVLYPHFVAVTNAAGTIDVHDIRQLFLSQRSTARGCDLLATLPDGFNEAYGCGDAVGCRDFLDAFSIYMDALPALVKEQRQDSAAEEASPPPQAPETPRPPAPAASTPPPITAAAAPAMPTAAAPPPRAAASQPRHAPAPPLLATESVADKQPRPDTARTDSGAAYRLEPLSPQPAAPALGAPPPVTTPAAPAMPAALPPPPRAVAQPRHAPAPPLLATESVADKQPRPDTARTDSGAAYRSEPLSPPPAAPALSAPPPITTAAAPPPAPAPAPAPLATESVADKQPRPDTTRADRGVAYRSEPLSSRPPAPAAVARPLTDAAAPALSIAATPEPQRIAPPPAPPTDSVADAQPQPDTTRADDGSAHWSEPLSFRHIPNWRPEPRAAASRAPVPPPRASTTPAAPDGPRPGVSRRFFAARHPAPTSADAGQSPVRPTAPALLGLHRKPVQLALAALGAVIVIVAVTSPTLWRHEASPPAPARTVAQQIVPPASPPSAPAMPAIPAAPSPKPEPPPLPATAEIGRPLSSTQVVQLQSRLKALGFNPGPADGVVGLRTVAAARAFQAANGRAVTGLIDSRLFDAVAATPVSADGTPRGQ